MEDATWDEMSESSFELVEAPDARVTSSPDLSPAPSLHEDAFEALEAGSPCSSSGGATAVLERSLCFTAMEEEATVGSGVSASSRASSMDAYSAASIALCEDPVDSTSSPVEPASPVAPAAATDPAPEEHPAATDQASKLPVAAATLGEDGPDSTAQGPATVAGSVPLAAPFGGATATAAAAAGTSAAPLEDPSDVSFWSTPAGMRLYAALSGTAAKPGPGAGEPAGGPAPRAVVAPPAAPAAKATALVTLAVVLVSMGAILVSVGRPSQPHVEATGCGVAPQDGPAWSRRCVMLYAPWDGLQANASSQPSMSISSSNSVSGASSNASFTTGKGPSWIPLSLDGCGWPLNWRPFRDWPCSLSAVAAAAGRSSSNASNCKQTAAATGNATSAKDRRQQHAGGAMARPAPGESTWDFAAFLNGVRGMWGDGAHANWSIWRNATPSVQAPTACRPGRPAYNAVAVPSQAAGGVLLLPWLPGMKPKVWFNHRLFQPAGARTAAAHLPLIHAESSSQPPAQPAALYWNGSFTGTRAGRPAWASGRLARPLPPWYLPTPPCYNLHALPARAPLAAEGPGRWLVAAMLPAPQAGVAGCNHSLIAAAAASKHPLTAAEAASADTVVPGVEASSATSGVRGAAAAAAAMPAAQAATTAAPPPRQGAPLSAAPTQDQQQQLALEAVRELVGGVLQRLRHMQQQHSGSWGRILDLLPPHFVVELQQVANTTQSLLSHLALPSGLPAPATPPVLGTPGGGSNTAGSAGTDNPSTQGNATLPAGSEGTVAGAGTQCLLGRCKVSTGRPGGLMGYVMALAAMAPSSTSSSSRGFLLRRPSSTGLVLAQPRHVMPVHMGTSRATCELPDTSEAINLREAPPHVLKAMLESTLSLPAAETRVQKHTPLRHTSQAAAAAEETPAAQQGATKRVPSAAASPPPTALHFMALPPAPREAHARLAPAAAPQAVALAPAETRYVLVERQGLLQGLVAVPQLPESEQPYMAWDALAFDGNHSSELQAPAAGLFQSRSNGSSAVARVEQHDSAVRGAVDELGFVDLPIQAQARAYTGGSIRPCAAAAAAILTSATPATSSNHTKRSAMREPHVRGPRAACSWHKGGRAGAAAGRHHPTGAALGQQPVFAAQSGKQAVARGNRTMRGSAKHGAAATMPAAAATTSAQPGRQQQNSSIAKEWPLDDFLTALRLGSASDYHSQQQRPQQAAHRQVVEADRSRSRTQGRPHQQQPQRQQQQSGPSSSRLNDSTRSTAGRSGPPHQQQQQARPTKALQPQQQQQRLGCDCLDVMAPWEQVMRSVSAASLAHMHAACATQQHLLQRLARTSQAASKRLQRHLHRFKRTLHTQGWHLGDWEHSWGAAEEWLGGSGTSWAGWVSDMQRWTHPVCDAAKQLQQLHARWQSRCKHCSIYDAPAAAKRRASQVSLCDCSACCNWAQPLLERLLDSQPYARLILNQLSRFSGPGQRSVAAWWRHLQQLSMQGGPEYMRAFRRAWGHKGLPPGMHQALQDLLQLLAQLPDQEAAA